MTYKKNARVSVIKRNIEKGESVPSSNLDGGVGNWVDDILEKRGNKVDRSGNIDLPEYGIDNKTRKRGSHAYHSIGSMTIDAIKKTENWYDTRYYKKSSNQNQIEWDSNFNIVTNVSVLDMDLPEIQSNLERAYKDLRNQVINGARDKHLKSSCGWAVFDGYNHKNSYRYRITDSAMKSIQNISKTRDTRNKLFE